MKSEKCYPKSNRWKMLELFLEKMLIKLALDLLPLGDIRSLIHCAYISSANDPIIHYSRLLVPNRIVRAE